MKISGNIGEWSELYVLLRLLADGRVYTATEDLTRMEDCFLPILKIFRNESKDYCLTYDMTNKNWIELYLNGSKIRRFEIKELSEMAEKFCEVLKQGNYSSFGEQVVHKLKCISIKASSVDKTDITMQVHDPFTNYDRICGYSIKSDIGGSPTLFNASKSTNFKFEILGLDNKQIEEINSIEGNSKIRRRVQRMKEIKFVGLLNETFSKNLLFIDTQMERFLAEMLKIYYTEGIANCSDLVTEMEERDTFGFGVSNLYRHKLKKFLCAVALGLKPTIAWNGIDEANGGYIIVKDNGEVVAYHLHDRNSFENYLLNNTKFDTPSSTKHRFGKIYSDNNRNFINLNFQIRFK